MKGMSHSSATKERWLIPAKCSYCPSVGHVTLDRIEGVGANMSARVKCAMCLHVWRIEPTPVWKILADESLRFKTLYEKVNNFVNAASKNQNVQVPPVEWSELVLTLQDIEEGKL